MTWREGASLAAVLSAMALVVLDAGLLNVALPTIANSLGETSARTILTVSAYQTAIVIGLLPCAHVAERIGYRRLFVGGLIVFTGASILCALASSLLALVAARMLQGLGGAAIMALGIALLRFALGPDRLGMAIGWNALTVALCAAAGPILGAGILSAAPWPWLFLAKLPVAAVALVAAIALPEVPPTRASVDMHAMVLHGTATGLILVSVETAVDHPIGAAVLVGTASALVALLIRRGRSRPAPLWPIDLLALRPFRIAAIASVCCFTGQSAGLLALPFYVQLGLGHGPVGAGFVLTCWPLAVAATGPLASRLAQHFGSAALCLAGGTVLGAGLMLAALWPVGESLKPLALGASLAGFGFGLFQVPNNRTMFLLAPPERSAAAGALQGSVRLIGQTLGAMLIGVLFAYAPLPAAARAGMAVASIFAIIAGLVSALELTARARLSRTRT